MTQQDMIGGVDEAMRERIDWAIKALSELDVERKSIGEQMRSVYADMEARGVPRAALRHVMNLMEMGEEKRAAYEAGIRLVKLAANVEAQMDAFEAGEDPEMREVGA